jgi:hypothetical protein
MPQLDRIRDALVRRPFEPFSIKMTDGTICRVDGPEWLAIPPTRRVREIAFFSLPERGRADEFHTHWLNLALVAEVVMPGIANMPAQSEDAGDPESMN